MTSVSSASTSSFFNDLFTPLPHDAAAQEKDHLDHVAAYVDTVQGAWDLFRISEHVIAWIQMLPSLSEAGSALLNRVSNVVSTAGIGLSIPAIISDCNGLRRSVSHLMTAQDLPYSDPMRTRKINHAAKKSFLDFMGLTNDTAQAAIFADRVKIITFDAAKSTLVNGIFNGTGAVIDGVELIGECFKLNHYQSSETQVRTPNETQKLSEQKTLSWMVIAKDVASVGAAAIALSGILFGVAVESLPIAVTALLLSTGWLTMKLTSHFYNKIIVEAPVNPTSAVSV